MKRLTDLLAKVAPYSKALAAAAAALGVIAAALSDGNVSLTELGEIGSAVAGVVAVFGVKNRPQAVDIEA